MPDVYSFFDILGLVVHYDGLSRRLHKALVPFSTGENEGVAAELHLCRRTSCFPARVDEQIRGSYKCIPWRIAIVRQTNRDHIYFYAPGFVDFLAQRVVLVPFLRKYLIADGGFTLIGSSFEYEEKVFILFGYPGCGKTRSALAALARGARFIGDNELVILRHGGVQGLFDEIELRYRTIRDLPFWPALPSRIRLRLAAFHLVSLLSSYYVSFNVSLRPADLNIVSGKAFPEANPVFVSLGQAFRRLAISEAVDAVLEYESWYQELFGQVFVDDSIWQQLRENLDAFFARCSLWGLPVECDIDDILCLE